MNKFLMPAVLSLLLAAPAMAQPDHHGEDRDKGHNRPAAAQTSRDARPAAQPAARPQMDRPAIRPSRPADDSRRSYNRTDNNNNRSDTRRRNNDSRPDIARPGNTNRANVNVNRAGSNRAAVRPHARPDYTKYRRAVTAPRRFRAGSYRAPHGYHYRRWSYGQRLPSIYYSNNYWLSNFLIYGLFAPPPDAVWVRYGPDALLIDRYTGEIISIEYNVFY